MTNDAACARLARPGLQPLVDELARRFGDGPDPPTAVTLRLLTPEQRTALADLMGSPYLPPATTRIRVEQLCATVHVPDAVALRVVVEALRGPIPDRRAARDADHAERASLWSWLAAEAGALCLGGVSLEGWASRVRRDGVRGGLEHHRRRLVDTLAVLRAVPADGVSLAAFADDVLGDPHGLDPGRSVSRLALGALAHARGIEPPVDAESSRLLWETAGVAPDPLSSTVLAVGLTASGDHPLACVLAASAEAVEPVVLTLAQLRRWPLPPLPTASQVYIFENPSLVAEAASRDWSGPPIVCSSGRPTVAVSTLLRQLGGRGAALHQHADFDATGLAITAWMTQRAATSPWRMTAADFTSALVERRHRVPLRGTVPPTLWDPALGDAVRSAGVAVYEEELRAQLLDEIERSGR